MHLARLGARQVPAIQEGREIVNLCHTTGGLCNPSVLLQVYIVLWVLTRTAEPTSGEGGLLRTYEIGQRVRHEAALSDQVHAIATKQLHICNGQLLHDGPEL